MQKKYEALQSSARAKPAAGDCYIAPSLVEARNNVGEKANIRVLYFGL